jgi:hypothetical protein
MMKLFRIVTLLFVLAATGTLSSRILANIEYFFDSDPSPGNGTPIYGDRNTVELDDAIATAALAPGVHRLIVRAKDDTGVWGLPQRLTFFVPFGSPTFSERNVDTIEYYFDADPGMGNGTTIYSGRNAVSLDEMIAASALPPGIHRLYVRTRDDGGTWGMPQSKAFYIPYAALAFSERSLAAIEYFFDTDPGPGNGIRIFTGRNTVTLVELLDTSMLAPGIHRLYVRSRDSDGQWGMPQSITFLITWVAEPGTEVTRLEFFIDTDPGFGNGTPVELTPGASVSVDLPIPVGQIEHGNHYLYIRARNSEGGWGLPACCQFSDGIPAHLSISFQDGILTLSWEDLYGIDTYKVYSGPWTEGAYSEEAGGTFGASSWTAPVNYPTRFYQVRSVYGE